MPPDPLFQIVLGVLAPNNASLVERAVKIVELLGARIASPDEARGLLGLPVAADARSTVAA